MASTFLFSEKTSFISNGEKLLTRITVIDRLEVIPTNVPNHLLGASPQSCSSYIVETESKIVDLSEAKFLHHSFEVIDQIIHIKNTSTRPLQNRFDVVSVRLKKRED